jgi:hypothetical protein
VTSSLLTTFGMASITAGGIGMSGFFAERSTAAVIIFRSPRSCFGSLNISDSMFSPMFLLPVSISIPNLLK